MFYDWGLLMLVRGNSPRCRYLQLPFLTVPWGTLDPPSLFTFDVRTFFLVQGHLRPMWRPADCNKPPPPHTQDFPLQVGCRMQCHHVGTQQRHHAEQDDVLGFSLFLGRDCPGLLHRRWSCSSRDVHIHWDGALISVSPLPHVEDILQRQHADQFIAPFAKVRCSSLELGRHVEFHFRHVDRRDTV